ncbi:hypothetical protein C8Q79DRAFT_301336 [Trametes meyenii]|nr:hypothetical protein C8Q79DRAFT_301336 [Trametes meyenii]
MPSHLPTSRLPPKPYLRHTHTPCASQSLSCSTQTTRPAAPGRQPSLPPLISFPPFISPPPAPSQCSTSAPPRRPGSRSPRYHPSSLADADRGSALIHIARRTAQAYSLLTRVARYPRARTFLAHCIVPPYKQRARALQAPSAPQPPPSPHGPRATATSQAAAARSSSRGERSHALPPYFSAPFSLFPFPLTPPPPAPAREISLSLHVRRPAISRTISFRFRSRFRIRSRSRLCSHLHPPVAVQYGGDVTPRDARAARHLELASSYRGCR